jgi:hypothetical protein
MGKSYRRHHKRPKRKSTRTRRGGDASSSTTSSLSSMIPSSSSMKTTLQKHYENGEKAAQPHVDKINKMATDLHKQAYDSGKKSYKGFKYSSPTNFAIAKSGESAYSTASKSMQPHYDKMKSSMGSMGSSMGFSSLSTKTPNVKELQHAQEASSMGVPTAFSQTSQTSAL